MSKADCAVLALAGTAFALIVYLTAPSVLQSLDYHQVYDPNARYYVEALRAGRLPLWNPYVGLGRPFLADIESGMFYPPNLLLIVLGVEAGVILLLAAHVVLLILSTVAIARYIGIDRRFAYVAAFALAANSSFTGLFQTGQLKLAFALCYFPLLLLLAARMQDRFSRRLWGIFAAVLALQFLAGHPQGFWISCVGLATIMVGRCLEPPITPNLRRLLRDLAWFGGALLLGLLMCAAQLLPLVELIGQGNRAARSMAFSSSFAMRWVDWTSLMIPLDPLFRINWEFNRYTGIILLLAGIAGFGLWRERNIRALSFMSLVAVLIAAGGSTPFFRVFYVLLPGLSFFRLPARLGVLLCVAIVLSGSFLLSRRRPGAASGWIVAGAGALGCGVCVWFRLGIGESFAWLVIRCLLIALSTAALLFWFRFSEVSPAIGRLAFTAVVLLLALDLAHAIHGVKTLYAVPVNWRGDAALSGAMKSAGLYAENGVPPRTMIPINCRPNGGMIQKFSTYDGYVSQSLDRVWTYLHAALGIAVPVEMNTQPSEKIYEFAPFPYNSMNLSVGWIPKEGKLAFRRDPDPRAYLAPRHRLVSDWHGAIALMKQGHNFHTEALVEGAPEFSPNNSAPLGGGSGGSVQIIEFKPEKISLQVEASAPSILALAEAWYPGWHVRIDGETARCFPVNAWMRGAAVGSGRHEVEFLYHSTYLLLGAVISLIGVALTTFIIAIPSRATASPK